MRAVAVDGKTARGARAEDRTQVHLLAAFDHASGIVLGQTQVEGKTNEITAFAPLLDRIDLTDVLLTADALHTQRGHADYLHDRGAHYILIAKANQPTLHAQLIGLPWRQIPVADEQRDRGHGRIEIRRARSRQSTRASGSRTPASPSRSCVAADRQLHDLEQRDRLCDHQPALAAGPTRPGRRGD